MTKKFLRTDAKRHKKFSRRKKLKWRKPFGRHNKMREKKKGHGLFVSIGYRSRKSERGKIGGKAIMLIKNLRDLDKAKESAIIARVGKRLRKQIIEEAGKRKIKILNAFKENN